MNDGRGMQILHILLHDGELHRIDNPELWDALSEEEVREYLQDHGSEFGFDLFVPSVNNVLYLMPNEENDLFVNGSLEFRKAAGGEFDMSRNILMTHIAIILLSQFYGGETETLKIRELITIEDFLTEINNFFEMLEKTDDNVDTDYKQSFKYIADIWNQLPEGEVSSRKYTEKYGVINRTLRRFTTENNVIYDEDKGEIRTTLAQDHKMEYFLQKSRISTINKYIQDTSRKEA